MRVLYVIFVLCVGALLWAAVAAARHVARHGRETTGTAGHATDLVNPEERTAGRSRQGSMLTASRDLKKE